MLKRSAGHHADSVRPAPGASCSARSGAVAAGNNVLPEGPAGPGVRGAAPCRARAARPRAESRKESEPDLAEAAAALRQKQV